MIERLKEFINQKYMEKELQKPGKHDIRDPKEKLIIYGTETSYRYMIGTSVFVEGACNRANYFKVMNVPKTNTIALKTMETFEFGHNMEAFTLGKIENAGLLKGTDVEIEDVYDNYIIRGHIDAMIEFEGKEVIIEHKSYKDSYIGLKKIQGDRYSKGSMMRYHIPQLVTYMNSKKCKGIMWYKGRLELEDNLFLCELKDGFFYINGEQEPSFHINSYYDRLEELTQYVKEEKTPPRDYGYYTKEQAHLLFGCGEISKAQYERIMNNEPTLYFKCAGCSWKDLCFNVK